MDGAAEHDEGPRVRGHAGVSFAATCVALYVCYLKHGFRTVGIYKEQGLLDGRWVDTIVMEKLL